MTEQSIVQVIRPAALTLVLGSAPSAGCLGDRSFQRTDILRHLTWTSC